MPKRRLPVKLGELAEVVRSPKIAKENLINSGLFLYRFCYFLRNFFKKFGSFVYLAATLIIGYSYFGNFMLDTLQNLNMFSDHLPFHIKVSIM